MIAISHELREAARRYIELEASGIPGQFIYFLAHINRGVELLVNRVRGLENLAQFIKVS